MAPKKCKTRRRQIWVIKQQITPLVTIAEDDTAVDASGDDRSCGHRDDAADGADGADGSVASSATSSYLSQAGDSICSSECSFTAVAVEQTDIGVVVGGCAPQVRKDMKPPPPPPRIPRDTTPIINAPQDLPIYTTPKPSCVKPHGGNIGWFFANWGGLPQTGDKRERVDTILKKNPATVIGLCECDAITDKHLRDAFKSGATVDDDDPQLRVERAMQARNAVKYLTIRGSEETSALIGVRAGIGNELELLFWERRYEGDFARRSGNGKRRCYSRVLIARATLDVPSGALGTSHVVMVVHINNNVANLGVNSPKVTAHLNWLADKIMKYKVQIMMGDFNMLLFHCVAVFRSYGIVLDVCAWYPWKDLDGTPFSDSCAIFAVNLPGEYQLHHGLSRLHDADDTGLYWQSEPSAVAGRLEGSVYDRWQKKAGPGMPLRTYNPKGDNVDNWDKKIRAFLTPCDKSTWLVQRYNEVKTKQNFRRDEVETDFLRMKEKRLDVEHWLVNGTNVGGSHFPLCVFSNNTGRRSEKKEAERRKKRNAKRNANRSCGSARAQTVQAVEEHGGAQADSASVQQPWPQRDPADGYGWSSSSWVAPDGTSSHVWHCWWSRDEKHRSGGASYSGGEWYIN